MGVHNVPSDHVVGNKKCLHKGGNEYDCSILNYTSSLESREYYTLSLKILASLSGFQITRRSWSKETLELFLDHQFFVSDMESLQQ